MNRDVENLSALKREPRASHAGCLGDALPRATPETAASVCGRFSQVRLYVEICNRLVLAIWPGPSLGPAEEHLEETQREGVIVCLCVFIAGRDGEAIPYPRTTSFSEKGVRLGDSMLRIWDGAVHKNHVQFTAGILRSGHLKKKKIPILQN